MGRKRAILCLLAAAFLLVLPAPGAWAREAGEDQEEALYEKSGAGEMYDSLDGDARELLSRAGVEGARVEGELELEGLFQGLSQLLREELAGPLKAAASLLAVILLCRLASCLEAGGLGRTAALAGTVACAGIVAAPLAELIHQVRTVSEAASAFLLASVPVYAGLMVASGSAVTGGSYSFLTLAAGNAIPLLVTGLILPLLTLFLALALVSAVSAARLGRLASSLYGFAKWALLLAVTLFSGFLSVQTALNAQVDAAANKAAKLLASSAIPIVGGAFGDAVAAIQNSVHLVKSGVGAFGILASLCIFAPAVIQAALWVAVCTLGEIAGDVFETPKLGAFLGSCAGVARMLLAVLASICAVSVVSAAVVLFVKGGL